MKASMAFSRGPRRGARCRTLALVACAAALIGPDTAGGQSPAPAPPAQSRIAVGQTVHLSASRSSDVHIESIADADPTNPNRLIACAMTNTRPPSNGRSVVYWSNDGGKTWTFGLQSERGGFDPDCAFGPDGSAYFLSGMHGPGFYYTLVWRSTDGGRSWGAPARIENTGDRPWLGVDRSRGARSGYVYATFSPIFKSLEGQPGVWGFGLATSRDSGRTFGAPIARAVVAPGVKDYIHMRPVVLSHGALVAIYSERFKSSAAPRDRRKPESDSHLLALISDDGGKSYQDAIKIADEYSAYSLTTRALGTVSVDPSTGSFRDRIYVTWADFRSGRSEIMLSYSADSGKRWTRPKVISDDRAREDLAQGPDEFMPVVAVAPSGVVGVMYYDRRDNADNVGYYPRFTASLDGGETWLPSVRVSSVPNVFQSGEHPDLSPSSDTSRSPVDPARVTVGDHTWLIGGHTAGMGVGADNVFHPVWVDNRTRIQQLYTAAVTVRGSVVKNGSADLAALRDVSRNITLTLSEVALDPGSGRVTANARLRNISKDARDSVRTPLKARVVTLRSDIAVLGIDGADNGVSGPGAVWDFSSFVRGGTLAPGDSSDAKRVVFLLTDRRSRKVADDTFRSTVIDLDARILSGGTSVSIQPRHF